MTPQQARLAVGHSPAQEEAADDIVFALRHSIQWHADQDRPHSEMVDRDALAEIERLRTALHAVRASTDPVWAAQIIADALGEDQP